MTPLIFQVPIQGWECPNCDTKDQFNVKPGQSRMHDCPGLGGFMAPLVPEGTRASVTKVEREDYVGSESVTYDSDGRPIMAVNVEREDGSNDRVVFAPCVNVRMEI